MNNIIHKIKDWLKLAKPQFEVISSEGDKIIAVRRLKDDRIFKVNQNIGHIRVVGFLSDLITVYVFETIYEAEDKNKPLPKAAFISDSIFRQEETDNIRSVSLKVRQVEIDDIEVIEDINRPGWQECKLLKYKNAGNQNLKKNGTITNSSSSS